MKEKYNAWHLILVISLFFLWAVLHNMNSILIPDLKGKFNLSDKQSSFIDSSIYLSYFLFALPAGWVMQKFSYKTGIVIGLILFLVGNFLTASADYFASYIFFLIAFFCTAAGATFLETVANPFITKLGSTEKATQRLNFAQTFNGLGSAITPIIGGYFIFTNTNHHVTSGKIDKGANSLMSLYIIIGTIVITLLLCFLFTHFNKENVGDDQLSKEVSKTNSIVPKGSFFSVLKITKVRWAILAQFVYVGVQVGTGSFFIKYANQVINMPPRTAAFVWGLSLIGFLVGRIVGTFLMSFIKPVKLLLYFTIINIALSFFAVVLWHNPLALYCLVATPFFMSIMYPTIFSLGIEGLNKYQEKYASSFIVMSIVGGAFFPFFMAAISDVTENIQLGYIIPILCYIIVFLFSYRYRKSEVNITHEGM